MAAGRTSWWPKDAAWHRRELIVELGEEFGAEGPNVMDVLSSWAQEQKDNGTVRGGFRVLAREAFVTVSHAESIVSRAASIGALDDLDIDSDGKRFTCRVSGWQADAERGRAAVRQATKRNRGSDSPEQTVTDRDVYHDVTPSPPPHHTTPEVCGGEARAGLPTQEDVTRIVEVLGQCSRLRIDRVGVENAVAAWPGRDHLRGAHTVVTWASDPAFYSTNAAKLLGDALSKQTPEKAAAVNAKTQRTDRRLGALRALTEN